MATDPTPYGRDINQPAEEAPKVAVPNDDDRAFSIASKLYQQGKQLRKSIDGDWDKWERFYNGQQWENRSSTYKARPNLNIIRSTVQTVLPIMTDTSPAFDILPQEPNDYPFADAVNELVDSWWQKRNMQLVLTYSILDSLIFPCGILKCVWNNDLDGIGDIEVTRVDPRNIYVDKDATDFTDAKFVCEEKVMSVNELRVKFPEKASKIFGSGSTTDKSVSTSNSIYSGTINLQSPTDRDITVDGSSTADQTYSGIASTKVVEVWIRDETLEEIDAGEGKKILKKKYPRGRVITILPESKVCLQTTDNPYGDGKTPYIRIVDTVIPGKFWGEGEVQPLIETQKMLNKVGQVIMDWCNRMTNGVWVLDDDSGVTPQMITNQIGLILVKRRGSQVERMQAPGIPSEVFNFYQLLQSLADQQSGIHDITAGRAPTGITAAVALQELQDAAQTRIRLKERNLQAGLVQLGYMVISRMLQFYTTPRVVRITGQQQWPDFYEVYFTRDEMDNYIANKKVYQFAPETRQYVAVGDWQQVGPSVGEFDIEVQAGTSLPFMRQRRANLAMQLYNAQAIDQEALLSATDFPDYQQIMRRMQEKQAAQPPAQPAAPTVQPMPAAQGIPAAESVPQIGAA